ncbi:hypothetical protein BVC80_8595g20 [Macleaya cordata]|uniref:Uncharacterized protein n=1 Tax=Macleaya cordata TaxID=56857 RepID=A0A200PP64_MACCD|nr:hypothetical protein BVC80_8595g20 [Macleaya cordata]
MESERPHRSGSELFICFTSRNSSSMKVSSKSIHSPGRSEKFREPSLSLSSSLSRRLRSNGSMKGGQASPMFPTGSKKKGSSFETAEPSSPKVTCIGQVRVKTKKQGQKMRTRSKRRGEVSFRKTEQNQEGILLHHHPQQQQQECLPHRNQRWVHLPLSICEALRAFGAEFSCFLPCRSSCLTGEKEKAEKKRNRQTTETNSTSSCRAVFARWVMTLQENEEEKRRDMELVTREEERREKREVLGEIEMQISEDKGVISNEFEVEVEEEEEGRVSICIPPRNALLLMRCRSEPFRTSALANRFWESPGPKEEEEDQQKVPATAEEDDEDDEDDEEEVLVKEEDEEEEEVEEVKLELEEEQKQENIWESPEKEENKEDPNKVEEEQEQENTENAEINEVEIIKHIEEEIIVNGSSSPEAINEADVPEIEVIEEPRFVERAEEEEELVIEVTEEREESRRPSFSSRRVSVSSCTKSVHEEEETELEPEPEPVVMAAAVEERLEKSTEPKLTELGIVERERTEVIQERETKIEQQIDDPGDDEEDEKSKERESDLLPDCLLLMMCEPKLSMEVSKETWVCSTDFIRYRPERKVIQKDGGDEPKKRLSTDSRRLSTDSNPGGRPPLPAQHSNNNKHQKPPTPPRRSVSKPSAPPAKPSAPPPAKPAAPPAVTAPPSTMATMIEQKLVNAVAYEPFVLTRCKSEPMRSSAKLAPEACFWKNMKLEPHAQGPPSLGVGATGIGF